MDDAIRAALRQGQVIDITTTGRKSGEPRRLEIVFHVFDGRIYISGMPRSDRERAWLLNLRADPRLTFHLKNGPVADLPATARVIDDPVERHEVLAKIARVWRRDPSEMEAHSPLIEVRIDGAEAGRAA
jgi:deazaflavin-dependent oxidoreductase (nitroreductase family)